MTNSMDSTEEKEEHYKGWPNSHGFDPDFEVLEPVELQITGKIPQYAAGTLYRTGPGKRQVQADNGKVYTIDHWFDGFNQVHRFQIVSENGTIRAYYNSRMTVDNILQNIRRTGRLDGFTFAQKNDPCQSYFQKFQSLFFPATPPTPDDEKSSRNVGVTVAISMPGLSNSDGDKQKTSFLTLKTDATQMSRIHPETLEPIGLATQALLHPDLTGPLSAAHCKSDPVTGDIYNYNLDIGSSCTYRIFHVSARTGETRILAKFTGAGAYIHSLFLTADHVILCVWNSHYSMGGLKMLWEKNILDAIGDYDPSKPATWYVIHRREGGLLATYESPAFFSFHSVNAWVETKGGSSYIVAELAAYDNLDMLKRVYYENLMSNGKVAKSSGDQMANSARSTLRRYRLPAVPTSTNLKSKSKAKRIAVVEWTAPYDVSPELPTLNPNFLTIPHRYTYGIIDRAKSSLYDGLVKYDSLTKEAKYWEEFGHTPGEAIFIPDPNSKEEDGGVLLSVVFDGINDHSYLICLDARTMTELGRADVRGVVGFGFHGAFAPAVGSAQPQV
ncbi:hypothetical protein BT63DRAFT_53243 [Microthyrium microscopicum]|uniref:Carotenoid oxygenase n=1 Tax=Microthyrium microscopicum TaxID=703497 RepID=A0A6A6U2S5_9PEZI|nr:hypothetical protein BT63DRAFT_53243 [Microthyrium microscopicum]